MTPNSFACAITGSNGWSNRGRMTQRIWSRHGCQPACLCGRCADSSAPYPTPLCGSAPSRQEVLSCLDGWLLVANSVAMNTGTYCMLHLPSKVETLKQENPNPLVSSWKLGCITSCFMFWTLKRISILLILTHQQVLTKHTFIFSTTEAAYFIGVH